MISGIVLAAGTSSRMGRPKQLLALGDTTLLRHVVGTALGSALDEVVVVLGHASEEIAATLPSDPRLRIVRNPRFDEGQSTSLRAGLLAMGDATEAAVVLLGDQPGVTASAISAVIGEYQRTGASIVQASYDGRPGHPTLLAAQLWPEASSITGDEGARGVIDAHPADRTLVEIGGDPPHDVDTEADYRRVRLAFEDRD